MQNQAVQEALTIPPSTLESLRVLVVDDEPVICETLQFYLKHLGIKDVELADNGKKALERMGSQSFDYVFLDNMMPELGGLDVLKAINVAGHLTSVILMTGYPSMNVVIDAIHSGASDFLVKPFRLDDVKLSLEKIQRLHYLMEQNWALHQELEKKKEVEELNNELERRIRLQTVLYHIVDSLSKIGRSEGLYRYVITKAIEFCNAKRACFLIYDRENSQLLPLARQGFKDVDPGKPAVFRMNPEGRPVLPREVAGECLSERVLQDIELDRSSRRDTFLVTPFNIRNEPFGVLIVGGKEDGGAFDEEDEFVLRFLAEKAALNIENIALYGNLKQSFLASLMALVIAIEAKDAYTQQHSTRVTDYAVNIARKIGCSQEDINRLETAGPLHDIGKIGVRDNILNKPGRLTEEEFSHIKTHPTVGANIVMPLGLDDEELAIIRNHHERWDGKGYPDGFAGAQIPALARILAVADSFDAMNSDRAYRKALPFSVCLMELEENAGSQFDPEVVKAALETLKEKRTIA